MNRIQALLILIIFELSIMSIFGQSISDPPIYKNNRLTMKNEKVIFSFMTKNNKIMSICISNDESYIVYRYGTKDKIELEYPENKKDSWSKFKYKFYWRGGGPENEGMDLHSVIFKNKEYAYEIFEDYYSVGDIQTCGIRINDSKKTIEIKGDINSAVGSLIDLNNYEKIIKENYF